MPKNKNGEWDFEVYNENEDLLYPSAEEEDAVDVVSLIIKETHVPVMWTFNGFVIVNGIVYISANLVQIVVADAKPSLAGKCLLATKKDSPAKNSGSTSGVNATIVYDSDEEVDTKVVSKQKQEPPLAVEEPPNTLEEEDEEKFDNVIAEPVEIQPPVVVTVEEPKKKRVAKKA